MESFETKAPPRFSGENYTSWAFKFEQWMQWKDLWYVFSSDPPSEDGDVDVKSKWKRQNAQGYSALTLSIGDDELAAIKEFKDKNNSAKLAWITLRSRCVQKSHLHRLEVRNKLGELKMVVGEPLEHYITRCEEVRREHVDFDIELLELDYIWAILKGLPQDWSLIIMSLHPEQSKWSIEHIFQRLRQEELRRTKLTGETAMVVGRGTPTLNRGRGRGGMRDRGRGHGIYIKPINGAMTSSTPSNAKGNQVRTPTPGMQPKGICHYCKKPGHLWRFCRTRPSNWIPEFLKKKDGNTQNKEGGINKPKAEFSLIVTTSDKALSVTTPGGFKSQWFLDSGCTSHMTPLRHVFHTFKPVQGKHDVTVGNEARLPVLGEGTIVLEGSKGAYLKMQRVLYVPDLMCSLLSVRSMTSHGHAVQFDADGVTVIEGRDGKVAATGTLRDDMYRIDARPVLPGVYKRYVPIGASSNNMTFQQRTRGGTSDTVGLYVSEGGMSNVHGTLDIWHRRLSHAGKDKLRLMIEKKFVNGARLLMDDGAMESCPACVDGKLVKAPFRTSKTETSAVLEIVHSDIMGPLRTLTRKGAHYVITIVDDFSRYNWAYLVKRRTDFSEVFNKWIVMAERQSGMKLKVLRSDRGGEYMSWSFQMNLQRKGILHQSTVPYNPQQNGVAERLNRTLMDGSRSLLSQSGLRERWWGDALLYTSWCRNRMTHAALQHRMTPYERWHGDKADISLARVFGCMTQVLVPAHKVSKTGSRAEWAMFVGIEEGTKGWKFWSPVTKKDFISRDARFYETLFLQEWYDRKYPSSLNPLPTMEEQPRFSTITTANLQGEASTSILQPLNAAGHEHDPPATPLPVQASPSLGDHDTQSSHDVGEMQRLLLQQLRSPSPEPAESTSTEGRYNLRERRRPVHYGLQAKEDGLPNEPHSWEEAMNSTDRNGWMSAAMEEWTALHDQGVFEKVRLPHGRRALDTKWVFKVKTKGDGSLERFKARLVARGFRQVYGLDYHETFAPVGKYTTARTLLAIATARDYEIHQMDISNAFLHGDLEEEVYLTQPQGFEDGTDRVLKLKKSLYGLKQSPRCWNKALHKVLLDNYFKQSSADPSLYILDNAAERLWLLVYVDDLLMVSPSLVLLNSIKCVLTDNFKVKDLGEAVYYLGMNISRNRRTGEMWLSHTKYASQVVNRFGLADANPAATPLPTDFKVHFDGAHMETTPEEVQLEGGYEDENRQHLAPTGNKNGVGSKGEHKVIPRKKTKVELQRQRAYQSQIGSLMFTAICIRPDLSFAVGQLAQAAQDPDARHESGVKRILRYLQGTTSYGIHYAKSGAEQITLQGYSDSDWAGCTKTRKSVSGWIFMLCGAAISWQSKKQSVVAMSSCEAEYIALSSCAREAVWLRRLLSDLGEPQDESTRISVDNTSAIALARNPEFHARTKHIQLHYHYIRQAIAEEEVDVQHCGTKDQVADGLTKSLPRDRHQVAVQAFGLEPSPLEC